MESLADASKSTSSMVPPASESTELQLMPNVLQNAPHLSQRNGSIDLKQHTESDKDKDKPKCVSESNDASGYDSNDNGNWDRRDFKLIEAIKDEAFKKLLFQHLDAKNELNLEDCRVIWRTKGTYNHCRILSIKGKGRFAIKVPAHGTATSWHEGDAFNLRSEVYTMKYIRRHTKVPVPEIFGWDNTFNNVICAPYILMRAVEGRPMFDFWVATSPDRTLDYMNVDQPSPEHFETRRKILKNLAFVMAELGQLEFDKIGMLHFEDDPDIEGAKQPTVGHYFEYVGDGTMAECFAYSSTESYFQAKLHEYEQQMMREVEIKDADYGFINFYNFVYKAFPQYHSSSSEDRKETFVLAHSDLDLQNIYVNAEGEITNIIDWNGTFTVPRSVGYAALPLFLREDWDPDYDIENAELMPWLLNEYRDIYSQYMKEAIVAIKGASEGDAKYTRKSSLYCAAYQAMDNYDEAATAFLKRLFKEIPVLRALNQEEFLERLSQDLCWDNAEQMLLKELPKLFAP